MCAEREDCPGTVTATRCITDHAVVKTKNRGGPGAQGLQAAPRRGPKGESWGILRNLEESWRTIHGRSLAWCGGPHAWYMHYGPLMVAVAILQLNFQRNAHLGPPCIKISPAAHAGKTAM